MKIIKAFLISIILLTMINAEEENKKYLNFKIPLSAFAGYNIGIEPEFELTRHITLEPSLVLNPVTLATSNNLFSFSYNQLYIYGLGAGISTNFYLQELGTKFNQFLKLKGHYEYYYEHNFYAFSAILGYQVLTSRYFNFNIGLGDTLYYKSNEFGQMLEIDFQLGFMF